MTEGREDFFFFFEKEMLRVPLEQQPQEEVKGLVAARAARHGLGIGMVGANRPDCLSPTPANEQRARVQHASAGFYSRGF